MKREQAFMICPLFCRFFNFSCQNLCFFVGLRPFWGFFGLRKASGLAQAKKSPKRPPAYKKTQILPASVEKTAKKVDASWKKACSLFIFGPLLYLRAVLHETLHFIVNPTFPIFSGIFKLSCPEKSIGCFLATWKNSHGFSTLEIK